MTRCEFPLVVAVLFQILFFIASPAWDRRLSLACLREKEREDARGGSLGTLKPPFPNHSLGIQLSNLANNEFFNDDEIGELGDHGSIRHWRLDSFPIPSSP